MRQLRWAGVLAIGLAGWAPAAAEPRAVPPHEVLTIVRSTGLNPLDRPVRHGDTYSLRAVDPAGQQFRVVVDAYAGRVLRVTLVRRPFGPGSGVASRPLPDEPDYIEPLPPGVYPGPPVVYEAGPPVVYGDRPPAEVPNAPRGTAMRPDADDVTPGTPRIIAPEPGNGPLPPPPERFPPRVAPGADTPKPAPRRVSAALPKVPPLPRPRPGAGAAASPAPSARPVPPTESPPSAATPDVRDLVPH